MSSTGTSPTSSDGMPSKALQPQANSAGGDLPAPGRTTSGTQSFMQRRRASFGKSRNEGDVHADRMLQGHFSVD